MADTKTTKTPRTTPMPITTAHDLHTCHDSLAAALAAFQAEVPTVRKGNEADVRSKEGKSFKYTYADLSDVTEKAMPLLGKHGLSFSAKPTMHEGMFVLMYELRHEAGEVDSGLYPLPNANTPAQQMGSAITYARRYVLCAITGIAPGGDDDDAGAIQQHQYAQQQRPAAQAHAQRPTQQAQPATHSATAEQWLARAEAASDLQGLVRVWNGARDDNHPTAVLDAIAAVGQRRNAEARAAQAAAAQEQAAKLEDPEATAIAAHEAELAAQSEGAQA